MKHIEEYMALIEFSESFPYQTGNDREIVIVGCAFLEKLIRDTLVESLIPDEKTIKELISSSTGDLPGFIQQARLLYLLGTLNSTVFNDLKVVAKIRNHFAHNVSARFEDNKVNQLCKNLKWHIESLFMEPPEDATIRDIYQVGINQLVCHLNGLLGIQRAPSIKFEPRQ